MSFRSEVKFRHTKAEVYRLKAQLKSQGMKLLFPSRIINSIYFDNAGWTMFHESNEGVMPRKKFRLRTYEGAHERCLFELKVSSPEGRYKESKVINPETSRNLLEKGKYFAGYGLCTPRIQITYQRGYYQFEDLRLTFDTNLRYSQYGQVKSYADEEAVMEAKFEHGGSCNSIYSSVHLVPSRFSKYERAVKMVTKAV
ncbi:VTC domain-containing protein [Gammaproteobacteria bacterium]|nr:VTC domain-containing protein [Gammaproteobacteria bacterium]